MSLLHAAIPVPVASTQTPLESPVLQVQPAAKEFTRQLRCDTQTVPPQQSACVVQAPQLPFESHWGDAVQLPDECGGSAQLPATQF